jgi:hypothetical protein
MTTCEVLSATPSEFENSPAQAKAELIQRLILMQADTPLADWHKRFRLYESWLGNVYEYFDFKTPGQNYVLFLTQHRPDKIVIAAGKLETDTHPTDQPQEKIMGLVILFSKADRYIAGRIILIRESGVVTAIKDFGLPHGTLDSDREVLRQFSAEINRLSCQI